MWKNFDQTNNHSLKEASREKANTERGTFAKICKMTMVGNIEREKYEAKE